MREFIDGAAFKDMIICGAAALEANMQQINELNVFPVPDGDTGTNMSLTMNQAVKDLQKVTPKTVGEAAQITASSMLKGARGNSGVILSLLFRGLSKNLRGRETADALEFANAMVDGVNAAYKAVMKPAEGTILTVSRVATRAAAEFAEAGSDFDLMMVCCVEAAREALAETVHQNPVLEKAGVVDSGGTGYVYILEAMLASLQGRAKAEFTPQGAVQDKADFSEFDAADIKFGYCTEFIVSKAGSTSVDMLRAFLESIGDSVVVVDDDEIIKTHVHTNDPGKVLTKALAYGSLMSIKIENMREQHTELGGAAASADDEDLMEVVAPEKKYGVVAICAGEGMNELFHELGADRVVTGGQTMNPSTDDILREIEMTPAEIVFVLPNNKNIIMAAEQAERLVKDRKVVVIPTTTVPQGVAALLGMDPAAEEEECTQGMTEAMKCVHTALVTYAARDSEFDGHDIRSGEYLGLYDGALLGSFPRLQALLEELRLSFDAVGPEFISVYYGEDVDEENAQETSDALAAFFPDAEVSLVYGGQPVYYYMISAE